jgi:hypothetical protein
MSVRGLKDCLEIGMVRQWYDSCFWVRGKRMFLEIICEMERQFIKSGEWSIE